MLWDNKYPTTSDSKVINKTVNWTVSLSRLGAQLQYPEKLRRRFEGNLLKHDWMQPTKKVKNTWPAVLVTL